MRTDPQVRVPIGYILRQSTTVPSELLREFGNRRLHFALRRFEDQIRTVTVRLQDENGPRGGVDTRCVITVDLKHGEPIVVHATSAWPTASITAAAKRLNEVIRRRFDRQNGKRRAARSSVRRIAGVSPPTAA